MCGYIYIIEESFHPPGGFSDDPLSGLDSERMFAELLFIYCMWGGSPLYSLHPVPPPVVWLRLFGFDPSLSKDTPYAGAYAVTTALLGAGQYVMAYPILQALRIA